MSNEQRLPFSTTNHPALLIPIQANNVINDGDVRGNEEVNEYSSSSSSSSSCSTSTNNNKSTKSTTSTNRPSTPNFSSATLKDIDVNEEGSPIGLFGVQWKNIAVKSLRPVGRLLNNRGYSNMSKKDFIQAISLAYLNRPEVRRMS